MRHEERWSPQPCLLQTTDSIIRFFLFACFVAVSTRGCVQKGFRDECFHVKRIDARDMASEDYDKKLTSRIMVKLQTFTITGSKDWEASCKNQTVGKCKNLLTLNISLYSKLDLHPWEFDLLSQHAAYKDVFPAKFKFSDVDYQLRNPLRIDLMLAKKTNLRTVRFDLRLKIDLRLLSGKKFSTKNVGDLRFIKELSPGYNKSHKESKGQLKISFHLSYRTINCSEYENQNNCSGHFQCGENGTRICAENYYGYQCKRYCKKSENYRCSALGFRVCMPHWHGRSCNRHCQPNKRYTCDKKGNKVCRPGFSLSENKCKSKCEREHWCLNGGWCARSLGFDSACICLPGWSGNRCEKVLCGQRDCQNGGECLEDSNGDRVCHCVPPFTGLFCETVIACTYKGKHWCHNFAECSKKKGQTPTCDCLSGFHGPRCEHQVTFGTKNHDEEKYSAFNTDLNSAIIWASMIFSTVYTAAIIWYCGPKVVKKMTI